MQKLEEIMRNTTTKNKYRSILYLMIMSTLISCQKTNTSKQNEHVEQQKVKNTHDTSEISIPTTALNCEQIDTHISKLKKTTLQKT